MDISIEKPEHSEKLKIQGIKLFSEGKFLEAIEKFSSAILLLESDINDYNKLATLYSNRALCYFNLNKLEESFQDSEKICNLNPSWFKGYYRKGQILYKMDKYYESLEPLNKALSLTCKDNEKEEIQNLINTVTQNIAQTKTKKNLFLNAIKNEKTQNNVDNNKKLNVDSGILNNSDISDISEDYSNANDCVEDQYDFLMSQFIKPYEEDAFRSLAIYHGIPNGDLDKESAKAWIKFAKKYGAGDSPELLLALLEYMGLTEEKLIKKKFEEIEKLCGIIY